MWFTRVSLNNPVMATMAMLALVVLGLFSIQRLQVDMFPNVDFPVVVVTTDYPGASPSIVEDEISKKIEESVNGIAVRMTSYGNCTINSPLSENITTIVNSIRKVKSRRQLIFVTHNPNIPVLGQADRVFVLASDGRHGRIARVGTVDDCREDIVTLLEGGRDAFMERKERYGY